MWQRSGTSSTVIAAVLLSVVQWAAACGPFFPNTIIDGGDQELLSAPEGQFSQMVAGLTPPGAGPFQASKIKDGKDLHKPTADADLADLELALAEQKMPPQKSGAIVKEYAAARETLRTFANELDAAREKIANKEPNPPKLPILGHVAIPNGLPAEFDNYLRGAVLYYQGKPVEARKCWQAVLDLPPEQSRYRATWAAYMIARSYCDSDPATAAKLFPKVRDLAQSGYRDSMGLAAASYGWQGRAQLAQGHYEQAVELYLLQRQSGDDSAVASLQYTCGLILKEKPTVLQRVAKHDASRQLVTAYIVSKGGPFTEVPERRTELAWLGAVEAAGLKDVRDADKLAWAAYAAGEYKVARRWLDHCRKDTPIASWIESKLLLRAGKTDEAARKLSQAVEALPRTAGPWQQPQDDPRDIGDGRYYADCSTAAGELATLKLHRCQYVEALDLLYRNGWWTDAAYVAERVLTLDELVQYVEKNWPHPLATQEEEREKRARDNLVPLDPWPPVPIGDLRHLLARRLVRAGQLQLAAKYMPKEHREALDRYAGHLARSSDKKLSQAARAEALWKAARIAREKGMELMGYELEPDAAIWDGGLEYGMVDSRLIGPLDFDIVHDKEIRKKLEQKVAPASADEKKRLSLSQAQPNKRFHYRYKAAEMAWQAAQMMPDESDQTALVLCEAGTWLKIRDPKAADRFYKALVQRCGQTSLGRTAESLKWFPDLHPATQPSK